MMENQHSSKDYDEISKTWTWLALSTSSSDVVFQEKNMPQDMPGLLSSIMSWGMLLSSNAIAEEGINFWF